ncbi:hypothetical protein [Brasilonema sennae]|uniref:hypothetical protein n=1 Tax=Brasilonema sennae TaxID=1397703 RepID=UPI00155AD0C4|nr:hypothetical protein [Brasilonema sennae]
MLISENDTAGKKAIARNFHYVYLGTVADLENYPEYKTSVWDLFELEKAVYQLKKRSLALK